MAVRRSLSWSGWAAAHPLFSLYPLVSDQVDFSRAINAARGAGTVHRLGMTLPGLKPRAAAVAQLPALGLLTLARLTPPHWTCSYHEATRADELLVEDILRHRPALVALTALTASVGEAYRLSALLRQRGARVVLDGLHATACPDEGQRYCDAIVAGDGEPVWPELPVALWVRAEYVEKLSRYMGAIDPYSNRPSAGRIWSD